MDLRVALTVYDAGMRPWQQNINDRVAYQRAFSAGTGETKRIAQAMLSQNPATPREEIKQNMTVSGTPDRFGYNDQEPTVRQVLAGELGKDNNLDAAQWNDFSGSRGETNSTLRYNGMWF